MHLGDFNFPFLTQVYSVLFLTLEIRKKKKYRDNKSSESATFKKRIRNKRRSFAVTVALKRWLIRNLPPMHPEDIFLNMRLISHSLWLHPRRRNRCIHGGIAGGEISCQSLTETSSQHHTIHLYNSHKTELEARRLLMNRERKLSMQIGDCLLFVLSLIEWKEVFFFLQDYHELLWRAHFNLPLMFLFPEEKMDVCVFMM